MKLRIAAGLSILVLAAFAVSCTQGTLGIFASLQRETKIVDRGLDNGLTPTGMTLSNNYYYLAAGSLYVRPRNPGSGVEWKKIDPPSGKKYVNGVGEYSSTIYAVFYTSGTDSAIYSRPADGSTSSSAWTDTGFKANGSSILSIGQLFSLNGEIFISVKNGSDSYCLYYTSDGSTFNLVDGGGVTNFLSPVIAAAWSTTGTSEGWFATLGALYHGTDTGGVAVQALKISCKGYSSLGGVWVDDGTFGTAGDIYVTSGKSLLKSTDDTGSSWTVAVSSHQAPDGSDVQFTYVDETANDSGYKTLIVGTKAPGLYW